MITLLLFAACAQTPDLPAPTPTPAPATAPAPAPAPESLEAARAYAAEIEAGRSELSAVEGQLEEGGDAVIRVVGHQRGDDLVLIEELVEVGEYRSTVQRVYLRTGQPVLARHSGMAIDASTDSDSRFRYFEEEVVFVEGAPAFSQQREVFVDGGHAPTPPDLSVLPWVPPAQPLTVDVAGMLAKLPQQ